MAIQKREQREDSIRKVLSDSPWDVLVGEIIPRLFFSSGKTESSEQMYDGYTAEELLDRVVVVLLAGWLGHQTSGRLTQDDLGCALEDVCRVLAFQWYSSHCDLVCISKIGYSGYKELILDDNTLGCPVVCWNGSDTTLIASVNRYGSCVNRMGLCCVDEMYVRLKRSVLSMTVSIQSTWRMEPCAGQVASLALVRAQRCKRKTYGEVIQDLYRDGLYPDFLQKKGRPLSATERQLVRVCDMEARQCVEYPGFSNCDVLALFVSADIVWLQNGEDGRQRVRIEFLDDCLFDTMEQYCNFDIVFTYGSNHPVVYHLDGSSVYHPCRLKPLEDLVKAKRNRVRGYSIERMNEWIPLKEVEHCVEY